MSLSLVGIVKNIIFESNDSLYKILKIVSDNNEEIVVSGFFPLLSEDLKYEFIGDYIVHPKYGKQFKATTFIRLDNNSREGIIGFLSSSIFKGVGERTAKKIYDALGDDCLNLILEDYEILSKASIPKQKQKDIYNSLKSFEKTEKIYVELYNYGLTSNSVQKLYDTYKDEVLTKIKSNPYRLIYEVDGYGFNKSDSLALTIGFSMYDDIRIKEGILYSLNYVCNNEGYVFLTDSQLKNTVIKLLSKGLDSEQISIELIDKNLLKLINEKRIIKEENRLYLKQLYENEIIFSQKIRLIKESSDNNKMYSLPFLIQKIQEVENKLSINYTSSQRDAIINCINNNISIITGGPGTGKTTIIKGILNVIAQINNTTLEDEYLTEGFLLMAPTGRAAKRMSESTGLKAYTIHKALGYNYESQFSYNEDNPLSASLIIIDESSMIDINLATNLFKAISIHTKVIIVGDEFQLPSIGPGNVLHDLIESKFLSVSKLVDIMRQSSDSDIIKLSTDIRNQDVDFSRYKEKKEVIYYDCDSMDVPKLLESFVKNFLDKGGNLQTDLQILVPMYSGVAGIDNINKMIQNKFNFSESMIVRGDKIFKKNDKVLQLKNDPVLNIMNGDIGIIKDIYKDDEQEYLIIDFDGNIVNYKTTEFDNIQLAYAISIHKSQGSEYKNVIMPVVPSYFVMLKKKLIYTGVTRAKQKIIIIGKYSSFIQGISTNDEARQTTLLRRLSLTLFNNTVYINDPDIPFNTLGEENMENITPYSFMEKG